MSTAVELPPEGFPLRLWGHRNRTLRLIWIGQLSSYFALVILTLRNYLLLPAPGYLFLSVLLVVGFLPSAALSKLSDRLASHVVALNAIALTAIVVFTLNDWTLSEAFILAPVFSLLFRDRSYIFASAGSLVALSVFVVEQASKARYAPSAIIMAVNTITIYAILIFIIYVIIRELLQTSVEEAKRMQTIMSLTRSVEARDRYTYGHSDRVAAIARWIATHHPQGDPETAYSSGLIHDVGKLSIPDAILLKAGRLTEAEFAVIRKHPEYGADICASLGIPGDLIAGVLHHHERWDGRGYPGALSGGDIPLVGRIMAVADALDAMASNRAYREALEMTRVYEELVAGAGTQFDPEVASIALRHWSYILKVLRSRTAHRTPVAPH